MMVGIHIEGPNITSRTVWDLKCSGINKHNSGNQEQLMPVMKSCKNGLAGLAI